MAHNEVVPDDFEFPSDNALAVDADDEVPLLDDASQLRRPLLPIGTPPKVHYAHVLSIN